MPLAIGILPAIIVAVAGLLVLYGLAMLLKTVIQSMANNVPLIGGPLGRAAGAIIDGAVNMGYTAASAVVSEATALFLAPVFWIERHITSAVNFFRFTGLAISYIVHTLIPRVMGILAGEITTAYENAVRYTQAVAGLIYAALSYDLTAVYRTITQVESQLVAYAERLTAEAEAYTTAAINAETRFVEATAVALEHEIEVVFTDATRYAQTLYADAIHYTEATVTAATDTLIHDITQVTTWATGEITALDRYIAAVRAETIAYAAAAAAVVETELEDLKSECTDNLCSGLSDLADLFNALTGDLGIFALFGLAARFAADPVGAAGEVESTLGPVARDAAGAARTLIGI
jgi:hypothetical protein